MKKFLTLFAVAFAVFAVNAQTSYLTEDFEAGMPAGWTQLTDATDGGFNVGTSTQLGSQYFPIADNGGKFAATNDDKCDCDKLEEFFIMPAFDFTAAAAVALEFDFYYYDALFQAAQERAYIAVSTDAGATWTNVEQLPGAGDWQNGYKVDLSAYAGMSNVWVAFRYTDDGDWLYGLAVDNINVFSPVALDAKMINAVVPRYALTGTSIDIQGTVVNNGTQPLTSFDLKWTDGVNTYTDNVTGVNVPYLGSYDFTHSTSLDLTVAKAYNVQVWVENPNSLTDGDDTNNQSSGVAFALAYAPAKKMLVEEATGTWCGWCPRGTEWMDYMAENYPDDFIGIAVHNGDPMTVAEYDAGLGNFPNFPGYPSVLIERTLIDDPDQLENLLPNSLERLVPANIPDVTATLDVATRTLTVDASAEFATAISNHDFRFNVVLVEDGVKGTGAGYAQTNYYAGAAAPTDPIPGYGQNWDDLPATVPAAQMVYNHVGRAILGGWNGTASSIPATVALGEAVTKSYTVNSFNVNWNPNNMHVVAMVIDNATGEILNAGDGEKKINVVCPNDFGAVAAVTPSSDGSNGAITLTPPSASFGFGGYTYLWENGETTPSITDLMPGTYTLTITDKIGCSQTIDVVVNSSSAVEDIASLTSFSLSPNPASSVSVLNATFSQAVELNVEILSMEGKIVKSISFDKSAAVNHSFDISNFAEGMYMVKMSVGSQVRTERLVVTK